MAIEDYRTETNLSINSGYFKFSRVAVPKDLSEATDGTLSFKLENHSGVIEISGYGRGEKWRCRGTVASLVAEGIIQSDWCPGLPGNNKTRQTVLFKDSIPQLVNGNRRSTALPFPHITIIRTSKNKFEVEVPTTKKQREIISQAYERGHQRWLNERSLKEQQEKLKQKEEKRKQKPDRYSIPVLFKDYAIKFLNIGLIAAMRGLRGEHEFFRP